MDHPADPSALELEYSLIHLDWPSGGTRVGGEKQDDDDEGALSLRLVEAFCRGRWIDILKEERIQHHLDIEHHQQQQPQQQPQPQPQSQQQAIVKLTVAATLLSLYLQINFTGPSLHGLDPLRPNRPNNQPNQPNRPAGGCQSLDSIISLQSLSLAGEPVYHLTKSPALLCIAINLLEQLASSKNQQQPPPPITLPWWNLRAQVLRRRLLDHPVPIPRQLFLQLDHLTKNYLQPLHDSHHPPTTHPTHAHHLDLLPRLTLEIGLAYHLTHHPRRANDFFTQAVAQAQFNYQLTGVPGKRTKFQENELSQLVVLAQSRTRSTDQPTNPSLADNQKSSMPVTLSLNDDTLMEKTQFTQSIQSSSLPIDPSNQPTLHPLDQALLLALSLSIKNTSPNHGLTQSQISPFVERVLENPSNWSIHSMALLIRSRLESNRTRTVERSLLQLQALVDQLTKDAENDPVDQSTGLERVRWTWSLALPSSWELERELAQKFSGLGVTRSALEIFERLEMWEHVVQCYMSLGLKNQGSQLVKDLIEEKKIESDVKNSRDEMRCMKDPKRVGKLWCLLAELESNPDHWETAWRISGKTSSRAMRSLGAHHFMKNDYPRAKECLRLALKINPLFNQTWFIYGCAAMRTEDWDLAETAFRMCVNLDDEDAEAWNNLATVYLKQATFSNEPQNEKSKDQLLEPLVCEEEEGNGTIQIPRKDDPSFQSELGEVKFEDNDDDDDDDDGGEQEEADRASMTMSRPMAAFYALQRAVKLSYDSWKMHTNYMVVAMSVGEYMEAMRALGRLVEIRAEEGLDIAVLKKLIEVAKSSTSASTFENGAAEQEGKTQGGSSTNKSQRLLERLIETMDTTMTVKCPNSSIVWELRSELSEIQGNHQDAIQFQLNAYRVGVSQRESDWMNPGDTRVWEDAARLVTRCLSRLERLKVHLASSHPHQESHEGIPSHTLKEDFVKVDKFVNQLSWNLKNLLKNFLAKSRDNFAEHELFLQLEKLAEQKKKNSTSG